jgi:hypothetical protein
MVLSGLFLFLSVLMICVFSFVSIAVWTEGRRKEREAYYKAESMRRLSELPGDGAKYVIEMMQEEERIRREKEEMQEIKQREGLKIGGLVNIGVGVGLYLMMRELHATLMVGAIPGMIGVALLAYALIFPRHHRPS